MNDSHNILTGCIDPKQLLSGEALTKSWNSPGWYAEKCWKEANDLALAQPPRENAGDTPRSQVATGVETEGEGGCCQQRLVRRVRDVTGDDFLHPLANDLDAVDESNSKVMSIKRLKQELEGWYDDTEVWFDYIFIKDPKSSY